MSKFEDFPEDSFKVGRLKMAWFKFDALPSGDEKFLVGCVAFSVALIPVTIVAALVFPHEQSYHEKIVEVDTEFHECLGDNLTTEQVGDIEFTLAFPSYFLAEETRGVLEKCRADNPMPLQEG